MFADECKTLSKNRTALLVLKRVFCSAKTIGFKKCRPESDIDLLDWLVSCSPKSWWFPHLKHAFVRDSGATTLYRQWSFWGPRLKLLQYLYICQNNYKTQKKTFKQHILWRTLRTPQYSIRILNRLFSVLPPTKATCPFMVSWGLEWYEYQQRGPWPLEVSPTSPHLMIISWWGSGMAVLEGTMNRTLLWVLVR